MMLGTNWVAPGAGASVGDLLQKLEKPVKDFTIGARTAWKYLERWDGSLRTNIELTGEPLQSHDMDRIAICDVR